MDVLLVYEVLGLVHFLARRGRGQIGDPQLWERRVRYLHWAAICYILPLLVWQLTLSRQKKFTVKKYILLVHSSVSS